MNLELSHIFFTRFLFKKMDLLKSGEWLRINIRWCLFLFVFSPFQVYAITPTDVFQILDHGRTAHCGKVSSGWVPVIAVRGGLYRSVTDELRSISSQMKRATTRKKASLKKRQTSLKNLIARIKSACSRGPSSESPQPTPTRAAPPAPTSTPIGCFAAGGNTRPGCFAIPIPMIGNIDRGGSYFRANCTGCHASRPAYDYTRVRSAFDRVPQMSPFLPDNQTLADIVAYLNRFNF